MTVDKKISYEVQGGVKNYLGKQKEVTAPIKWKSSPDHPETELAYITKAEKDLLVKKDLHGSLKGGVNRGPSGIMSLNGFGSDDSSQNVSGSQISAAETGGGGSGMSADDRSDFRSAAIASGAGQRVNPGFFDSRNTVSADELARARAFNPKAFAATRGGGLSNFFTGGGILGNIVRGLGQRFGLGKTFDEPTYDMRRFSSVNPVFDDGSNEDLLSLVGTGSITNTVPFNADTFDDNVNLMNTKPSGITTLYDEFIPATKSDDNRVLPKTIEELIGDPKKLMAEVTQKDIDASKARGFKMLDRDTAVTLGLISPNVTDYEFEQLKQGNITQPGTYTT